VPDDVAALTARAAALGDAADSLAARQNDVDAAVAAWEASRAAAEAAAREVAEREAARRGAAAEAWPPRGARASGPSGGSSDGGHWEETVTYDDTFTVCMDTEGNAWFC
jgi:peptidoglycan hydrolase CwlO-like protein